MPPPRLSPLPRAGEVVQLDFRDGESGVGREDVSTSSTRTTSSSRADVEACSTVRLLQWNIERGYELDGIIAELKRIDADVLALQEIDIGCARSQWEDTGEKIARALKMNYIFVCEFEELYSAARGGRSQGGGVHGNAILTKFDMTDVEAIHHRFQPVDWEDETTPLATWEPRRGRRVTLAATIKCPRGDLVVYSAHLEVFSGILGRLEQFSEILTNSKKRIGNGQSQQAILGDLNTMGHGIARMSPQHCNDDLRWKTLGMSEGQFWLQNVLSVHDPAYGVMLEPPSHQLCEVVEQTERLGWEQWGNHSFNHRSCMAFPMGCMSRRLHRAELSKTTVEHDGGVMNGGEGSRKMSDKDDIVFVNGGCNKLVNEKLLKLGLSPEVCGDLLNPGFRDPFDVHTTTLEPDFTKLCGYSLMKGKLDWLLLRALEVRHKEIGNHDYALSDHKWLSADILLSNVN